MVVNLASKHGAFSEKKPLSIFDGTRSSQVSKTRFTEKEGFYLAALFVKTLS